MTEHVMGGLVIATGLMVASVGMLVALNQLRVATRVYHKTQTLHAALPEGWGSWFLGGFSGVAVGTHGLWAAVAFAGGTLIGVALIGLGLLLSSRT